MNRINSDGLEQDECAKLHAKARLSANGPRRRRLIKIADAQYQIENELLFSKKTEPTLSNDLAFRGLYYLVRLAKAAK